LPDDVILAISGQEMNLLGISKYKESVKSFLIVGIVLMALLIFNYETEIKKFEDVFQ